jgi:hypothetical protein
MTLNLNIHLKPAGRSPDNPIAVEFCVKGMIHKYQYRNNKEYYKISLRKLIKAIKHCSHKIKNERR